MITWQHDSKTYTLPDEWYWRNFDLPPNDFLNLVINNFNFTDLNVSYKMNLNRLHETELMEIEVIELDEDVEIPEELKEQFE